jgi:hypothetical protein
VLIVAEPSARLIVAVVFSILVAISCAAYTIFGFFGVFNDYTMLLLDSFR